MEFSNDKLLHEIEAELHDLCQPLTALHCRLELGKFAGDPEALREAVDGALVETVRMIDSIMRMRERVARMKAPGNSKGGNGSLRSRVETMERGARN